MKSSDAQLKNRGKITMEDLQHYNNHTKIELLKMMQSKEAYKRTIAVKLLAEKHELSDELTHLFLYTLTQEKNFIQK
ncbi:hypothetical protein AAGS61_20515 [Lysinibacillus sp. KU-BSD001]|uniref:hypothetical protein n=1 Tax=Lysinibacillus sp. KU-BSD001 TaxID=3141328 RepID=UPI0036EFACEA